MGYSTDFDGQFNLDRPLSAEHAEYLVAFNDKRRMKRDPKIAETMPDPKRVAVGLPIGADGGYFVGGDGFSGQEHDVSVVDFNSEPAGQPGLRCGWWPSPDCCTIEWDGGEKFYFYVEWLQYLVAHFLKPWGYTLNGTVTWEGEGHDDKGRIVVKDNVVRVFRARIATTYEEEPA